MVENIFTSVVENVTEGIYLVDLERRITFWNRSAERITGYSRAEVIGKKCSDNILRHVDGKGCALCETGCPLEAVIGDGVAREIDVYLHHKKGHRVAVMVRGTPLYDENGAIVGAIEIFLDRSERSDILAELERVKKESLTDQLTGLGNRRYLDMAVESRFRELVANDIPFGLLIADIDHFKLFNDTHGHDTGDSVLKMVAGSIAGALRRLDEAARWGGEEFAVLVPNADEGLLGTVAERVRMLVEESWLDLPDGTRLRVTVSIGGALARPGDTPELLLVRADGRLYKCKQSGRNRSLVGD